MSDEQQNQLDELRRAIRELPDDEPLYYPIPEFFGTYDLKALEAELTRVEGEYDKGIGLVLDGSSLVIDLQVENARLTARVEELEAMIEEMDAVQFGDLGATIRWTGKTWGIGREKKLGDSLLEAYAALKSKEAGEENG